MMGRAAALAATALWLATGCPGDDAGGTGVSTGTTGVATTTTGTGPATTMVTTGADTTDGATTTSTTGGPDICADQYPLDFPPEGLFDAVIEPSAMVGYTLEVDDVCPDSGLPGDSQLTPFVYRPADPGTSDWPDGRFPFILFVSGRGLNVLWNDEQTYDYLFNTLAQNGFVVAALQLPFAQWDETQRLRAFECGLLWMRDESDAGWPDAPDDRLNCDLTVMGHSLGGFAAHNFVARTDFTDVSDLQLVAAVGIASAADVDTGTVDIVPATGTVPYLLMQGAKDEDPTGDAIVAYDRFAPDDPPTGALSASEKVLLWVYDVPHRAWGGRDLADQLGDYMPRQIDKAEAIARNYITGFLRWQVFGETEHRDLFVEPARYDSTAADFPAEIGEAPNLQTFWGYLDEFDDNGMRPLLLPDFAQGVDPPQRNRLEVDTLFRDEELACDDVGQAGILSPSTSGQPVSTDGFVFGDVCIGPAEDITVSGRHETFAMRILWDDTVEGSSVRWDVNADLSGFRVLSFRVGRAFIPLTPEDPLAVEVELETADGVGIVTYDRVIRQDTFSSVIVPVSDYMHTVRIPLTDLCAAGAISVTDVDSIALRVPANQPMSGTLIVDSLEFTRGPGDPGLDDCS